MKSPKLTPNRDKYIIYLIAVLTLYAAVFATMNVVATPGIGYIDSSVLLEKYSGAIAAREKLDAEGDKWSKNIETLETELTALDKELTESGKKLTTKERKAQIEQFEKKRQEYARYKQAVTEKATKLEQELMKAVFDELNAYMEDFGKETGHKLILGTVSGGNILYAQEATNLTDAFLAFIEART